MTSDKKQRIGALVAAFLAGTLLSLLGVGLWYTPPQDTEDHKNPSYGLDDEDILLYVEAVTQIKEKSSWLEDGSTRADVVAGSIRAYLAQPGHCCDYLPRDAYRDFKESLKESYVGIGMEIKQDASGRIICLPHPDSPAAQAGIAPGERLLKINGVPMQGKSIFSVAAAARGRPGTEVAITVGMSSGAEKRVEITRSAVALESVSKRGADPWPIIRVSHYTRDTSMKMRELLAHWPRQVPIIIDLRGNGGGDLHAAIDSAMLFLATGKPIVSVETRKGTVVYDSRAGAVNLGTPVYLWQDEGTASAAEVFIAALTQNNRAVSIGKPTAGKATREAIVELSDGSALILATGKLLTPTGFWYQGKGLPPSYRLQARVMDTKAYLSKVKELSGGLKSGELRSERQRLLPSQEN
jgi:carboxyl-terminal processing protease